jgi:hypothetical protein
MVTGSQKSLGQDFDGGKDMRNTFHYNLVFGEKDGRLFVVLMQGFLLVDHVIVTTHTHKEE